MGLSLGAAINDPRANIVTINLALDFIGVAKVGDAILIQPRVIRVGSTTGFCDALVVSSEKPIARANATFSVRLIEDKKCHAEARRARRKE